MQNHKITIVIPTFNRNASLAETVRILLPQLDPDVNVVILDNSSPIPVKETLIEYLGASGGEFISVVRNNMNVGGDANIVRCFEHATGDWIWVLADDDLPDSAAISIIRETITNHPGVGLINYYTPCPTHPLRPLSVSSHGIEQYLKNMDALGSHLFLPASIYSASLAKKYIKIAYRNIHTFAAHLSICLSYMQDGGTSLQSSNTIVRFKSGYRSEVGWSRLFFAIGCSLLPDLLHNSAHRKLLRSKIAQFLPFKSTYAEALIISKDFPVGGYGRYLYMTALFRVYFSLKQFHKFLIGLFLASTLYFPNFSFMLFSKILFAIKGVPAGMTKMKASEDMHTFYHIV